MAEQQSSVSSGRYYVGGWAVVVLTMAAMCMICSVVTLWKVGESQREVEVYLDKVEVLVAQNYSSGFYVGPIAKQESEKPAEVAVPPASTESSNTVQVPDLEKYPQLTEEGHRLMGGAEMELLLERLKGFENYNNAETDRFIELRNQRLGLEYYVFGDIKFVPESSSVTFVGFQFSSHQKVVCSMELDRISVAVRTEGVGVSATLRIWTVTTGTREKPLEITSRLATILVPNVKVAVAWLRAIERWKKERQEYLDKFKPRVVLPPKEDKKKEPF